MPGLPQAQITARHLERRASIDVRPSTPKPVPHHPERQRHQDALVPRAIDLGWPAPRVHVIDPDLGPSGQDRPRPGFQALVAAVSRGHVGLMVADEASRLARNHPDGDTLLDLATVVGTLIADPEGGYDPRQDEERR